ncbi:MAG: TonB C-terminal domain-containing protein [Verrucomicrobia bacterium]|nr:TonB C-terminal domain-containing protein [Verrucomicrobiota bacterium]
MSLVLSENVPWSGRRWFLTIALLTLGQFALILALTESSAPDNRVSKGAPSIRIISSRGYEKSIQSTGSRDPTLFALVHPQGFSGAAWLRAAEFPYQLTSPMQPPQALAAVPGNLGQQCVEFIRTNLSAATFALAKLAPTPNRVPGHEPPPVFRPHVTLEGTRPGRVLLDASNLPPADPSLILTNCVVSVMVAPNGDVLSPTLLASSGSPATDAAVLTFARTIRFPPLPAPPSTNSPASLDARFERLLFQWLPETPEPGPAAPEH